jgi:uncharacterized protein YjbJ (UPF0337 family)
MNTEKVEGKFDQVVGKMKQGVGEAVGNDRLANSGVADQVKGAAKETWGNAKDTAKVVHDDARTRPAAETAGYDDTRLDRTTNFDQADNNVRDSIAGTARKVRDAVNNNLDDVKRDHTR